MPTSNRPRPPSRLHVLVMAKSPVPGRVKTRLCPPCSPTQAAAIAEASLRDTLDAVAASGCSRRIVALDGRPGPWLPAGFEVIRQRGRGLDERLAAAWDDAGGMGLQIGMDTPQLTGTDLDIALGRLDDARTDAVLGPAEDGGWWAIGLRRADPRVFLGVPMSTARTADRQWRRLAHLDLRTHLLRTERDLDTFDDAMAIVAGAGARAPATAGAVAAVRRAIEDAA